MKNSEVRRTVERGVVDLYVHSMAIIPDKTKARLVLGSAGLQMIEPCMKHDCGSNKEPEEFSRLFALK